MTDIHCHILPGLDDGAVDMQQSLLMARVAKDAGTSTIIATPHYGHGCWPEPVPVIRRKTEQLSRQLERARLELRVLPGMELLCNENLPRVLARGDYVTLADSRYLLTEFYFDESFARMCDLLHLLPERGLTPIIAHPERYEAVQRDPVLVERWIARGYALQINAGSVLGYLGRRAQQAGKWLIHNGLAHVVASDGHGLEERQPRLLGIRDYLEERVSIACAETLLYDNPRRIAENRALPEVF